MTYDVRRSMFRGHIYIYLKNKNKNCIFLLFRLLQKDAKGNHSLIICDSVAKIFERTIVDRLKNYFGGQKYDKKQLVLFLNWGGVDVPLKTEKKL